MLWVLPLIKEILTLLIHIYARKSLFYTLKVLIMEKDERAVHMRFDTGCLGGVCGERQITQCPFTGLNLQLARGKSALCNVTFW